MLQIKRKFLLLFFAIFFMFTSITAKAEGVLSDVASQKSVMDEQILPTAGVGSYFNPKIYINLDRIEAKLNELEGIEQQEQEENRPYKEAIESLTLYDIELICRITYREAGNQCEDGQKAVMEVILNRYLSDIWPATIEEILSAPRQFSTWKSRNKVTEEQLLQMNKIITSVYLETETVLPDMEYVYFNNKQHKNSYNIQGHWFWK